MVDRLTTVRIETSLEEEEIEEAANDEVLSAEVVRELDRIEKDGSSKVSVDQARRYAKKFQEFVTGKGYEDRIETCGEVQLNAYLRYLYSELRGTSGRFLSPSTLGCVCAGISRYLTSSPVSRVVDVIRGKEFVQAKRSSSQFSL